jgi:pilus assembly protein CpaE
MTERQEDTIRLLIVDDHAETRDNIRKLLQFEQDIHVVGSARSGEEALQISVDAKPHVVLMDINMPDMDGITTTKQLKAEVSFAQIVILSVQNEPDYMRRAMQAGASDFLSKPPSGDELITAIRTAAVKSKEEERKLLEKPVVDVAQTGILGYGDIKRPQGKLLTIYSPKGGVGCTTLATNLAIGLNTEETPTVLVDGNLQFGDVSVFLNLQVKNSIVDLAARTDDIDEEIVEDVLMRHESGLRVLAAPPRPEMADEVNADQVKKVLRYLKLNYAYIVVDSSSTMDDITLAILDVSDVLLAVATTDIPSIKDSRLLFDLLSILEFPRENILFVLNKTDRRTGITAEAVSENLKHPVEGEIPSDERIVANSVNRGVPLLLGDKSRPIVKDLLDLLAAVKERLMAEDFEEERMSEAERARVFGR